MKTPPLEKTLFEVDKRIHHGDTEDTEKTWFDLNRRKQRAAE